MTDEELIICSRNGDADATDTLLTRYKSAVLRCARSFFLSGGGRDDLIQEGMIGLYRAILRYDPTKNSVFKSFAALCIRRQIIDAVRKSNSGKNYALNTYISLEDSCPLASGAGENPEERLIGEETYLEVIERSKNLSKLERLILERYLSGKTYAEIAAEITGGEKSVDNALQRIRKKLKVES